MRGEREGGREELEQTNTHELQANLVSEHHCTQHAPIDLPVHTQDSCMCVCVLWQREAIDEERQPNASVITAD